MDRNHAFGQHGQIENIDQQRHARQTRLADDFAPLANLLKRNTHPGRGLVLGTEHQEGVDGKPGVVHAEAANRRRGRHLLDEELRGRDQEIQTLDPSTASWSLGGVTFERLWPVGEADHTLSNNDSSAVLRLSYANHSVLLTGDIEARAQQALLNRGDLRADVLILPHHGSVCASTAAFIAAVEPSAMVRSSQQRMDDTLSALAEIAGTTPLYNTADVGAIEVVIHRDGVRVDAVGLDSS